MISCDRKASKYSLKGLSTAASQSHTSWLSRGPQRGEGDRRGKERRGLGKRGEERERGDGRDRTGMRGEGEERRGKVGSIDFISGFSYEVVIVDDFAYDFSREVLQSAISNSHFVRCFEDFQTKYELYNVC